MLTDMAVHQDLESEAAHVTGMAAQESNASVPQTQVTSIKKSSMPWGFQRIETALHSFWVLKNLTPEQVDNFMNSYVIYDLDWADEKMMTETLGPDYQKRVGECLRDYYSVLNHMCALGELEKMYIPPVMDLNATIFNNQILYEESIAEELQLPADAKVFDLGCGRGRVAAHMTRMTGALVTGLNIDFDQVSSAIAYNSEQKLSNEFIRADMNDLPLPLPDAEFDGFYQIQAFSLCKDIPKLCKELYRVLKPGARLSLLDWASLEAYNPEDEHHRDLMRRIKPLIGAVGTPTPDSLVRALESAGFKMLRTNNASIDGLQSPLIERAKTYFTTAQYVLLGLVRVGLLPAHFKTLINRFTQDGDAFIEADKARLITTSYHWLAQKPDEDRSEVVGTTTSPALSATVETEPLADPEAASMPQAFQSRVVINAKAKAGSPASSDRTTQSSSASSIDAANSPSPANSDSTGITEPPLEPEETVKSESPATVKGPMIPRMLS